MRPQGCRVESGVARATRHLFRTYNLTPTRHAHAATAVTPRRGHVDARYQYMSGSHIIASSDTPPFLEQRDKHVKQVGG